MDRERCDWVNTPKDPELRALYARYHDDEWGKEVRSGYALYERWCLEAFQAGLSWITILRKREAFRAAFCDFDYQIVAQFSDHDVLRLMNDPSIVRNRLKIEAAIGAARRVREMGHAAFSDLLWSFAPPPRNRPRTISDVPAQTEESVAMAKELRKRGFSFCGPTTCYALMQATGMVDDHLISCWVT